MRRRDLLRTSSRPGCRADAPSSRRRTACSSSPRLERFSSAEQGALMIREGPRRPPSRCETGDWAHVDVYLTRTLDYRAIVFAGLTLGRPGARVAREARRRRVVAVGGGHPGRRPRDPLPGRRRPGRRPPRRGPRPGAARRHVVASWGVRGSVTSRDAPIIRALVLAVVAALSAGCNHAIFGPDYALNVSNDTSIALKVVVNDRALDERRARRRDDRPRRRDARPALDDRRDHDIGPGPPHPAASPMDRSWTSGRWTEPARTALPRPAWTCHAGRSGCTSAT